MSGARELFGGYHQVESRSVTIQGVPGDLLTAAAWLEILQLHAGLQFASLVGIAAERLDQHPSYTANEYGLKENKH